MAMSDDENPDRPRIRMATLSTGSDPQRLREVREALAWLDRRDQRDQRDQQGTDPDAPGQGPDEGGDGAEA